MPKTYIVAEAGVNHNGSLDLAKQLIDIAAAAGADAVKFQTFKSEKVISKYAVKAEYQVKNTEKDESQLDMVKKLELDEKEHLELMNHSNKRHIDFLSTPFDEESVDLLVNKLKLKTLKVPSGEITNGPLLLKIARTGLPVVVSTGMASLKEVQQALMVLAFGYVDNNIQKPSAEHLELAYESTEGQLLLKDKVTLLHCTTEYPTPFADVNLLAMDTLREAFGLKVGYSDHSEGIIVPIAAAAKGAVLIEKHFTIDRQLPGPDHKASLEPEELKEMVKSIRQVETIVGSAMKEAAASEKKNIVIARKSIIAARDIKEGEIFTSENLCIKRPGTGISPMKYWDILGTVAQCDYKEDEVIV